MKVILHIDGVIKLETPSEGYVSDVILESNPIRIEVDHAKIIESLTAYLEPKVFMGIEVQADKLRKSAIDYEMKSKHSQKDDNRLEKFFAKVVESEPTDVLESDPQLFRSIGLESDKLRKTAIDYERKAKCNQAAADELEAFLGYCDTELSGPDDETEENDEDRIENQRRHYS